MGSKESPQTAGSVVVNPVTGEVAVFVRQYAEAYWRVVSPDDRSWVERDLSGWDVLLVATEAVEEESAEDE